MTKQLKNSTSWSDNLRTRKTHLHALLKTIDTRPGKASQIQNLTVKAIEAELEHIDSQMNRRK